MTAVVDNKVVDGTHGINCTCGNREECQKQQLLEGDLKVQSIVV